MQFSYDASKAQFDQSLWQYARANFFKEPHPIWLWQSEPLAKFKY